VTDYQFDMVPLPTERRVSKYPYDVEIANRAIQINNQSKVSLTSATAGLIDEFYPNISEDNRESYIRRIMYRISRS